MNLSYPFCGFRRVRRGDFEAKPAPITMKGAFASESYGQMSAFIKTMRQKYKIFKARLRRFGIFLKRLPRKAKLIALSAATGLAALIVLLIVLSGGSGTLAKSGDARLASGAYLTEPDETALNESAVLDVSMPTPTPALTVAAAPTPEPTPTPTPDPTLKRGVTSEEVTKLQERLMELGYLDIDESTQYFGPATEYSVELFQRQVAFSTGTDFAVDGVAGLKTLELIYSSDAPKYCVKEGMEGEDISVMQSQLVDLGYMKKTTGYYGDETIAAMKEFQDRNGLSPDGLAGEKTVALLYSDDARESASKAKEARSRASVSKMLEVAKSKLGCKYISGNRGPNSFDCSGLVYYCLNQAGSNRRRLNAAGYSAVSDWEKISNINDLKKGDLIFFYNDGFTKVGHVGIVVSSSGIMIDASSSNGKVVRRTYLSNYWKKHFVCGRRPW